MGKQTKKKSTKINQKCNNHTPKREFVYVFASPEYEKELNKRIEQEYHKLYPSKTNTTNH